MAMTHEQLITLGKVLSVLGALTIFVPWLKIDYYDYYGPIYETYNGFSLFNSGYYFGVAMYIPIVIMILFIVSYLRYKLYNDQRNGNILLGLFILMFLLSWHYNISANGMYDNRPYFLEFYSSRIAETISLILAFISMIVAYMDEKKLQIKMSPPLGAATEPAYSPSSDDNEFCPNCGTKLTTKSDQPMSYCPCCEIYIGGRKEKI
jgi:hypothetical protein